MEIKTVLLDNAAAPEYKTKDAAGADIQASVACQIEPGEIKLVKTGIKIAVPKGYEAQIRPRSGLAIKNGISINNAPGTIDSDYTGEVGVILVNHGKDTFYISPGDRIAQMVICPVERAEFCIVENLEETERGSGGFGHTGV